MYFQRTSGVTRRTTIKTGTSALLLAGAAPAVVPSQARAQRKTLKILQWKHFVPGYDRWFNEIYAPAWGEAHDTEVIVDSVGLGDIAALVAAEAAAGQGHDLLMVLAPPATYADRLVDHREIYEECERRFGPPAEFAVRSTLDPASGRYFGFCTGYMPAVMTYRRDLWETSGASLDTWDGLLTGGRRIKLLHDRPVGFSLAPEHNSEHTLRAILYSFGASVQDAEGRPALKSPQALEALRYVKALYGEAMTEEVLGWDAASNNRFMLAGEGSVTLDTMSIVRASESKALPVTDDLWLARAPEGRFGRLAPSFGIFTYFIWNFAANIDGASQFLVDYIEHSRDAFVASGFQNMPVFTGAVPDLAAMVTGSSSRSGSGKYGLLAEAASWTTNVGHPGYTSPAISEVYDRGLIPTMFAKAATGRLTPEQALDEADHEVRAIFQRWKERGKP